MWRRESDHSHTGPAHVASAVELTGLAVAHLVHDLKNHLTVIIGCAEHLSYKASRGEADHEITQLLRSAERATQLIREILTAARQRSSAQHLVDLNHVVRRGVEALACLIDPTIRLHLCLSREPVLVLATFEELESILWNLMLNARDAMANGGVLAVATATVGPHARLSVIDSGCGLAPEVQRRMFEPFFTTKQSGTGLGLSSLAFAVDRLHGAVMVDSHPGRGTTITVAFPDANQRRE
jgi:two-component system cell cycle sensor histidine kinase/response regulator CckA